jgi:protein-S-isoprenylcysteine O-methyltransferase Ste14
VTLMVQHFVWVPAARSNGLAPYLTMAAALAHAIAGAITGPRLVDRTRTGNASQAALLGAVTSLLALMLFAPFFTIFLFTTDLHPAGVISYIVMPLLVAAFALLADGWALVFVSTGVGWALYRLTADKQHDSKPMGATRR